MLPSEVEEVLTGKCRIFKRKAVMWKARICITPSARQKVDVTCRYFYKEAGEQGIDYNGKGDEQEGAWEI